MRHYPSEASGQKPVCPEGHNLVQNTFIARFECEYGRYRSKNQVAAFMRHYPSEASGQQPVRLEGQDLVQNTFIARFECGYGR